MGALSQSIHRGDGVESKVTGLGSLVFGLVLVIATLIVLLVLLTSTRTVRTVQDQTRDEMEVAPS